MNNAAVLGLKTVYDTMVSSTERFIEACPETLWEQTFGGWPIWQHVYHVLAFSVPPSSNPEALPLPFPMEVITFSETPSTPWSKADAQAFIAQLRSAIDARYATLTDADLSVKNEHLSQMFGRDMTQSSALAMTSVHLAYHLGVCDSALRERGLKGIL